MNKSFEVSEPSEDLVQRANTVRLASKALGQINNAERCSALMTMADSLASHAQDIVTANREDLERSASEGLSKALVARLKLDEAKLEEAIKGIQKVAFLPDPLGIRQLHRELADGLSLERVTVPLGVLGVIFEARPDALIQIASLAIRSGNGAILKGGSEARCTNESIMSVLKHGLSSTKVSSKSLDLLTTRQESLSLLRLDGLVDLIIPRGSNALVRFIQDNTRIPVLGHADGVCHLYIDSAADLAQALSISIDSKTQYSAACNAIETLLVHEEIASEFLAKAIPTFQQRGVKLLGDEKSQAFGIPDAASDSDWAQEYLDLILSVKVVSSLEEALHHINLYGSRHTEAIVTKNKERADKFLNAVDSSGVFHNCSTRFADGFRYGFGAEVGISTQTLPPRGPVGLEGLVTYRYRLHGDGHIAADFASGERNFTHKDLPI